MLCGYGYVVPARNYREIKSSCDRVQISYFGLQNLSALVIKRRNRVPHLDVLDGRSAGRGFDNGAGWKTTPAARNVTTPAILPDIPNLVATVICVAAEFAVKSICIVFSHLTFMRVIYGLTFITCASQRHLRL